MMRGSRQSEAVRLMADNYVKAGLERDALRAFAREAIEKFRGCDPAFEELALEHDLLTVREVDEGTRICYCYRPTALLTGEEKPEGGDA